MRIPNEDECLQILQKNNVPANVVRHSKAVAKFSVELAIKLQNCGVPVNINLTKAGSLLHDIRRLSPDHSRNGAQFLEDEGFYQVSKIVRRHGLKDLSLGVHPQTIEEKIVFYADKRMYEDQIVSLRERIDLLKKKYSLVANELESTFAYSISIERELQALCPDISI